MTRRRRATAHDVLFVDCYPQYLYGAQRTLVELATRAAQRPAVLVPSSGVLVDALDERGVEVDVLEYSEVLRRNGRTLMAGSRLLRLRTAVALVAYNLRAARIISRRDAAVVYCSNSRAVLTVGLGARLVRRPVIWYVQQLEESLGLADRLAARLATSVVSISPDGGAVITPEMRRRLGSRFTSIPLGTVVAASPPMRTVRQNGAPIIFGIVGAVSPRKGHDVFVAALSQVCAGRPVDHASVRARVLGAPALPDDEDFQASVKASAERSGVADLIDWVGWLDDVTEALGEIDVLVNAAHAEGLPRAIMEAMAQGLPVVATDVGATRDLVHQGETGLLVPAGDAGALAAAMARLADDAELRRRLGAAGHELVRERFDQADFVTSFAQVFEHAAEHSRSAGRVASRIAHARPPRRRRAP